MSLTNEEVKTPRERGNKEKYQCGSNANRIIGTGRAGCICECQPLSFNRDDWERGSASCDVITSITGGILEQLILEANDDLAGSEARVNQLQDRINLLKSLKASLDK
ncbi:MAG TPA: hypothetical protein VE956_13590 [Nodularia sp. (in: cyanobacteria)]|nr:hypothetical protein [Nodularia sp. (in: cyanobacteria)]